MSIKREITLASRLFEKLTGTHIYRTVPRGIDLFHDINNHLPNLHPKVVFDVGANIGQSAKNYLNKFPGSKIFCFEPVTSTFHQLQNNLHGYDNVLTFRTALGAAKGTGRMVLEGSHDRFFLLNTSRDVAVSDKSPVEEVSLDTLDGFCLDHNVTHINYLKIDTEGGDMDVLRGAENILTRQQVDVVEVEAGMNIRNRRHVPFAAFSKFFEEENYFLFGVYEQVNEWPTKEPHLRRTNPVFISDRVIKANNAAR